MRLERPIFPMPAFFHLAISLNSQWLNPVLRGKVNRISMGMDLLWPEIPSVLLSPDVRASSMSFRGRQ